MNESELEIVAFPLRRPFDNVQDIAVAVGEIDLADRESDKPYGAMASLNRLEHAASDSCSRRRL